MPMMKSGRERLPNRRLGETFELEVGGLRYVATIGRFVDGRVGEIFLSNHKSNSAADTNARDSAIVCSIALQCGADVETIRKALCRDSAGRPSGPLGAALDRLAEDETYPRPPSQRF
jgi:ribonucleoside-diphosphate reductase alpha chain